MPNPYIEHGLDVGRVKDPLVAHEMANTINARVDEKYPPRTGWFQRLLWRVTGARQRYAEREGTDSAHYQAQETVEKERRDPLTGLLNKTAYHQDRQALYANVSPDEEIIVARMDMGMLNYFNQTRGHGAGDQYLKQAALLVDGTSFQNVQDIYQSCRFAGAYHESGDEYVVLLKTSKDNSGEIMDTLRTVLSKNIYKLTLPGGKVAVGDTENRYVVEEDILLDIGVTTATEARNMLETVLEAGDLKREINQIALIAEVADRIADVRVDIQKAKKRVRMLKKLLSQDRGLYLQIYAYAAKGALAIGEEELGTLDTDETINDWIANVFAQRLMNDAKRKDDPFQKKLFEELAKTTARFVSED